MFYNALTSLLDKTREVEFSEAVVYALLGFAIVFLGIAFLVLVVWGVGRIMGDATVKGKKKAVVSIDNEKTPQPLQDTDELNEETVAVIMAALTAYYEQNNPKCEFTVKRIKRI